MRVAVIVLAHNEPEHLKRLVVALDHPNVSVYLHLDARAPRIELPGVTWLPSRACVWGGVELVDAATDGLRQAVADGCEYFLLISGADYPVRSMSEIVRFCDDHQHTSFTAYWPVSECQQHHRGRDRTDFYSYTIRGRRELCVPFGEDTSIFGAKGKLLNWALRVRSLPKGQRRFPAYAQPFAGRQWWNLNLQAATRVLAFLDAHPDYRAYHEHTIVPDEIFFNSILLTENLPVVNDPLRFMVWTDDTHPRSLTVDDIPAMIESGALFARKFDNATTAVVDRLERLVLPHLNVHGA